MNEAQLKALREVINYLAEEKNDYDLFVEHGGDPTKHIYSHIKTLIEFLKQDAEDTEHYSQIFDTNHGEMK
jgi:Mg2+ and Co2+ transporter CorA